MCREIIYFCAELLNYWSMTFFGLKLFAKVYEISLHKNKNVENVIFALLCLPISWHAAGNYKYATYSTLLTYIIIIYMYVLMRSLCKNKQKCSLSLIGLYVLCMKLVDLWIVAVISEANKMSRQIYIELIYVGLERIFFMFILSVIYYFVYKFYCYSLVFHYLKNNKGYRRLICIYSLFGNGCFSTVYRFDYKDKLISYWTFYLMCAFILIGGFLIYFVGVKSKERERLLNMRNDMLETNYKGLLKAYELNRTVHHDHKNHMLAISELIKENKNEDALKYIHNYLTIENKLINEIKSGNDIINVIVSSKIAETSERGIEFIYEIEYLNDLKMDDIDICALLANLLDNAVESCEKVINKNPKINLKIFKKNEMLLIQVVNSIHSNFIKKKYLFSTEKDNIQLHGWGMISIENVVRKYGGIKEYHINDDMIEIFITIPL